MPAVQLQYHDEIRIFLQGGIPVRKAAALSFHVLLFIFSLFLVSGAAADNTVAVQIDVTYRYDMTEAMLPLINAFRTGEDTWVWSEDDTEKIQLTGLDELVYDNGLERVAMQRAAECALHFAHTRPDGSRCYTIYPVKNGSIGENIAAGFSSVAAVFRGWQETDEPYSKQGHRRNMLNDGFTHIGIGCVQAGGVLFWCQAFSSFPTQEAKSALEGPAEITASVSLLLKDGLRDLSPSVDVLRIQPGQSADIPTIRAKGGSWKSIDITILSPDWTVADGNVAVLEAGKVKALIEGKTTLTVTTLTEPPITLDVRALCATHSWNDGEIEKEATCTAEGSRLFTCQVCGDTRSETLAMIPHKPVTDVYVAPTCVKSGLEEGSHCEVCQTVLKAQEVIPALEHDIVEHEAQDATCTEEGWYAYESCTRCDYTTYRAIRALGHNLIRHTAQEPDCTHVGWKEYETCTRCDHSTYEEIEALGHDTIQYEAKAATCTEIGWNAYETCIRCTYSTYEEIQALGHDTVQHEAKEPTCTEDGWDAYETCTRCDYTTYGKLPALGHKWGLATYVWSKDGQSVTAARVCIRDGEHEEKETSAVIREFTAPTETKAGSLLLHTNAFQNEAFLLQKKETVIPALNEMRLLICPEGMEEVGEEAFAGTAVQAVILPAGCTQIHSRAFANCPYLVYVSAPADTGIAEDAFEGSEQAVLDLKN